MIPGQERRLTASYPHQIGERRDNRCPDSRFNFFLSSLSLTPPLLFFSLLVCVSSTCAESSFLAVLPGFLPLRARRASYTHDYKNLTTTRSISTTTAEVASTEGIGKSETGKQTHVGGVGKSLLCVSREERE